MSLTAFLPTGTPQILPFIGTPGAATVGHALVWSQTPQGFTLSPITVGPDQFSGILPIGKGGTGTSNGSITGTGALTFTAGGTNQDINLNPSGIGKLIAGSSGGTEATINLRSQTGSETGFTVNLPNGEPNYVNGIYLRKGNGFFSAVNGTSSSAGFVPLFSGKDAGTNLFALGFTGLSGTATPILSAVYFSARDSTDTGGISPSGKAFYFENGYPGGTSSGPCLTILGNGNSTFHSTTESTSITTGAVRISGGLGVAKNINIGGNLNVSGAINFANLPTSNTGLVVGDLWRDGEIVKVKL